MALNAKTIAAIETQLGDFTAATRDANRALELDEARRKANPKDVNTPLDVAFDLSELAEAAIGRHDFAPALASYQRSLAIREELLRRDPKNERLVDRVAYMNGKIGLLLMTMNRVPEAKSYIQREYDLLEALAPQAAKVSTKARFAEARGDLGSWYCSSGSQALGRKLLTSSIAEIKDLHEREKLTFADAMPLNRLEAAERACGAPPGSK